MTGWKSTVSSRAIAIHYLSKLVCLLVIFFSLRQVYAAYHNVGQDLRLILLLIGDGYTILLIIFSRYSEQVLRHPVIMLINAVCTTYLLIIDLQPGTILIPYSYGKYLQIGGISLQIAAKIYIGKSFGLLPANRGVVTRGPYRLVRHPMYLGYFLNHLGFLLCSFSWYNLGVYIVLYIFTFYRLFKEEELLAKDPLYKTYMQQVPYRFLPLIF